MLQDNKCETFIEAGHSHIKRKVHFENALGFEKVVISFNKPLGYDFDDGINSTIQICNLIDIKDKKINKIIEELPKLSSRQQWHLFIKMKINIKLLMKWFKNRRN